VSIPAAIIGILRVWAIEKKIPIVPRQIPTKDPLPQAAGLIKPAET